MNPDRDRPWTIDNDDTLSDGIPVVPPQATAQQQEWTQKAPAEIYRSEPGAMGSPPFQGQLLPPPGAQGISLPEPKPKKRGKRAATFVGLSVFTALVFAGGVYFASRVLGNDDAQSAEQASVPLSTPTLSESPADLVTPTGSVDPAPTDTATTIRAMPQPAVPRDAFPGAGGQVPSGAQPVSSVYLGSSPDAPYLIATIVTPSGNIGCDFSSDGSGEIVAGCGVLSYMDSAPYGADADGARWWIDLTEGKAPDISSRSGLSFFEESKHEPQVVDYGKVVSFEDIVCGSAEDGLTCWNTTTGHGAFMNRRGFEAF